MPYRYKFISSIKNIVLFKVYCKVSIAMGCEPLLLLNALLEH